MNEDDVEIPKHVRQISINGLNTSVTLISTFDGEDMNFLSKKALSLLYKLNRKGNNE